MPLYEWSVDWSLSKEVLDWSQELKSFETTADQTANDNRQSVWGQAFAKVLHYFTEHLLNRDMQ